MKYSIWSIPPDPINSKLRDIIENLSNDFNGPIFEPHMTILGNIELDLQQITEKVKSIATKYLRLELSLGPISFSTTYFQNILVRVNSTAKLMQLNLDLKQALNVKNDVFMPHISLLYGNHEMTIREKASQNLKVLDDKFVVNKLVITPSTPNPSEWIHSATILLG